jgi:hypothetical protein
MNRPYFLVGFLIASTCLAQEPIQSPQQLPSAAASAAVAQPQDQKIVIPAGTRVPLSLSSPVPAKSAKPGYAIRAVTVFPVTVGTQIAIPVGTYAEGVIEKVKKVGSSGPTMQVHFTQMVFPNGYTVPVDAANTLANAVIPDSDAKTAFAGDDSGSAAPGFALAAQQAPAPPPLKNPGPPIGAVVGAAVGITVAGAIGAVLWARHHAGSSGVLFDTGWQFDMVLKSPISISAADVAAAATAAH